jgi:hypothetical protein
VSKRHQASRRRNYGRRQHEVRERHDRDQQGEPFDFDRFDSGPAAPADPFAFMDPRAPRIRFALGD